MRRKSRLSALLLAALSALILIGCGLSGGADRPDEEEIKVQIRLDLGEDIGLLLTDWNINGQTGMSGSSMADKSLIPRDSTEYWSFDKQLLDNPADTADLTLRFIVVTEYFEPDYDFDYPEKYKIPVEAVSFTANFGEMYYVTITGGKANGYQAVLEEK